jgi:hypothetical protein
MTLTPQQLAEVDEQVDRLRATQRSLNHQRFKILLDRIDAALAQFGELGIKLPKINLDDILACHATECVKHLKDWIAQLEHAMLARRRFLDARAAAAEGKRWSRLSPEQRRLELLERKSVAQEQEIERLKAEPRNLDPATEGFKRKELPIFPGSAISDTQSLVPPSFGMRPADGGRQVMSASPNVARSGGRREVAAPTPIPAMAGLGRAAQVGGNTMSQMSAVESQAVAGPIRTAAPNPTAVARGGGKNAALPAKDALANISESMRNQ